MVSSDGGAKIEAEHEVSRSTLVQPQGFSRSSKIAFPNLQEPMGFTTILAPPSDETIIMHS